ncbi:MAG: YraN family protein [Clostridia bacterium]|nr:YraN family protein [Clostridia bacterium]
MKVHGLGLKGELAARRFLRKKGWRILERNFQCRWGELDLIAQDKDCLVFCEVKTRSAGMIAAPQESVTYTKQQKMIKTALYWLQSKEMDRPMRFDVIAVTADAKGHLAVEHLENAFTL